MQEAKVGKDKLELVRLLQEHRVIIRGGGEEGQQLLNALLVSKMRPSLHCADPLLEWRIFTCVVSAGVETETQLKFSFEKGLYHSAQSAKLLHNQPFLLPAL